ncbi:MAG TPA: ATP-binding protein [Deltaproteobacteria bacterium]|nr:ATP-binding protein [Deltaproteobacteria bacterium]HOM29848.1 ATP-binding protein [Deltaproteobacteria bacterium]HPP80190.1 ATP-binding protein [Deltaproteobacteria bacterium]
MQLHEDERYLQGRYEVQGRDFVDAGLVSSLIKKALKDKGIDEDVIRRVAIVAFEAEVNIISYAESGTISLYLLPDSVVFEAKDVGPGIADIELALQEGYSTADDTIREMGFGAGMGLSNIKKSSDVFEISSEVGKGTCLRSVIRLDGGETPGEGDGR